MQIQRLCTVHSTTQDNSCTGTRWRGAEGFRKIRHTHNSENKADEGIEWPLPSFWETRNNLAAFTSHASIEEVLLAEFFLMSHRNPSSSPTCLEATGQNKSLLTRWVVFIAFRKELSYQLGPKFQSEGKARLYGGWGKFYPHPTAASGSRDNIVVTYSPLWLSKILNPQRQKAQDGQWPDPED